MNQNLLPKDELGFLKSIDRYDSLSLPLSPEAWLERALGFCLTALWNPKLTSVSNADALRGIMIIAACLKPGQTLRLKTGFQSYENMNAAGLFRLVVTSAHEPGLEELRDRAAMRALDHALDLSPAERDSLRKHLVKWIPDSTHKETALQDMRDDEGQAASSRAERLRFIAERTADPSLRLEARKELGTERTGLKGLVRSVAKVLASPVKQATQPVLLLPKSPAARHAQLPGPSPEPSS